MLKKILFKAGVNQENTRYFNEQRWWAADKVRFRQGTPEKIGGWIRTSSATFLGICRSLWAWSTLAGATYVGVGTNKKFYITDTYSYYDVTPLRETTAAGAVTFSAVTIVPFSTTITVNDTSHGAEPGSFVTFSGAVGLGGNITAAVLNQNYEIATIINANSYTILAKAPITGAPVTSNASDTGNGGAAVIGAYEVPIGAEIALPGTGWGGGGWGGGGWGTGGGAPLPIRLWSQQNWGEDLVMNYRGGGIYYWDATAGVTARAVNITSLPGSSNAPTVANLIVISDINRFTFALGCNALGDSVLDPMLIRWCDQEDIIDWTPNATNQAGDLRLSRGSRIIAGIQARQELLIWTDTSLYSLQYLQAPLGWGAQLVGENISLVGQNAVAYSNGQAYWMGYDKFYMYNGNAQTLDCDVRTYVFSDFNYAQQEQVCSGTNEQFNEIWWFYCSANSTQIDRYVVWNYEQKAWTYGTLARTAWLDAGIVQHPIAATYINNIVQHEVGVDDVTDGTPVPILAYIESGDYDLDDGDSLMFCRRVLPDVTFRRSEVSTPSGTLTVSPLKNSGSGVSSPASLGGSDSGAVQRTITMTVDQFTGQFYVRLRMRQFRMRFESDTLGVAWQLGGTRLDLQEDGKASGSGVSGG
jgi:hypothetical protein